MQGLYKLALVGTKEQLTDFLKKVNDGDPDSVFNEYAVEEGTGLRTIQGYGLEKFLDRYKLIIENTGSGNISGIEPMVDDICKIAPDLEIVLLTQYIDYTDTDWDIYYKPAGTTKPTNNAGQVYKDSGLDTDLLFDRIEFGDEEAMSELSEFITDRFLTDSVNMDDLKEYTKVNTSLSWNDMQECLDMLATNEADIFSDEFDALKYYFNEKKQNAPHKIYGNNIPSTAYFARLFNGRWGLDFQIHYRFHPETFDDRFAGKTFVITGEPDNYGKDVAKEIIENFGGVVRGAVSGKTDYLLVGTYAGEKKLEKAQELGTPIINADDFEQMIS